MTGGRLFGGPDMIPLMGQPRGGGGATSNALDTGPVSRRRRLGFPQYTHPPPPRRKPLHVCTGGDQHKAQDESGSSVAYNTVGPFLSQSAQREDDLHLGPPKGMHLKEGRLPPPPPPLQGAQPMPSHCPPDAKCWLQWHS